MIERLVENWLDKASERSFQIPFCHGLIRKGYTILHSTRHNEMEMGKDVLAIAPDGMPCAFQLKGADGGKITLSKWREDLSKQIVPLAQTKIVHPSINARRGHRSYVVTNGDFDEPVMHEIDLYNRQCIEDGREGQQILTIVRGEMLEMFLGLGADFWPPQLIDFKTLLEIYLNDGRGCLPKEKLATVLESSMGVTRSKKISGPECGRMVSGGAIITSMALSSYSTANNHVAEFEAWTMFLAYLLAVAERWSVAKKYWKAEADLAVNAMFNCLARLCEELTERSGNYVEGNLLVDKPLYRVRLTQLIGLMCAYGLWMREPDRRNDKHLGFIRDFCTRNSDQLLLWGEYAIPQFLAWYLYAPKFNATMQRHTVMSMLIKAISEINSTHGEDGMPNPYYSPEEILPYRLGLKTDKLGDTFAGESFALGPLVDLHVRANFKQSMKQLWPNISKIAHRSFVPEQKWEYYLWRSERGTNLDVWPNPTQHWESMISQAHESSGEDVPKLVKDWPVVYLSYLIVAPHRINRSGVRWLATAMA